MLLELLGQRQVFVSIGITALPFTESEPTHIPTGTTKGHCQDSEKTTHRKGGNICKSCIWQGTCIWVYKEILQLNKKTNNPTEKMSKGSK